LINPQADSSREGASRLTRVGAAGVSGLLAAGFVQVILQTPWTTPSIRIEANPLPILGGHFFGDFLLSFELISVLLLVALIGAIVLARRETQFGQLARETDMIARPKGESK